MIRITAMLCAALLAIPAMAQEASIVLQPDGGDYGKKTLMGLYFVPQLGAWCAKIGLGNSAIGGCVPEYEIPPDELRALRAAAGLSYIDAPVWNGAKGEFVALSPSE